MSENIQETIVELINQASLYGKDTVRVQHLRHVQELILRKDPSLLDNFLEEVLGFQSDKSPEVRKTIISFIEEACQHDPEVIVKVIDSLQLLLYDDNILVQKKLVVSMITIYRLTLKWLSKSRLSDENVRSMWKSMANVKNSIITKLDSDNDGLRTVAIKFIEMLALVLSRRSQDSIIPASNEQDFSLNLLQEDHRILCRNKLEQEGKDVMEKLLEFTLSQHLSSVNLIAAMGAIANIARQRPDYMSRVVQTFEALQVNLPPTLVDSQVSSVRKIIKLKLLSLLKHPASLDFQPQITTLLTDLGATQAEVLKHLPKGPTEPKRKLTLSNNEINAKKSKLSTDDVHMFDKDDSNSGISGKGISPGGAHGSSGSSTSTHSSSSHPQHQTAIDITAADLVGKLSIGNVVDLVLVSMLHLPEKMPASFQSTYTPIAAAGTPAQIEHLARLLGAQLTAAGYGKGYELMKSQQQVKTSVDNDMDDGKLVSNSAGVARDGAYPSSSADVESKPNVLSAGDNESNDMLSTTAGLTTMSTIPGVQQKKMKPFKLADAIKPIEYDEMQRMSTDSFYRILNSEDVCETAGVGHVRKKTMTSLVCLSERSFRDIYEDYIFAEVRKRYDLAFAWLYQEYVYANGYLSILDPNKRKDFTKYDDTLCRLLDYLQEKPDQRDGLFSRLLTSAPLITDNALLVLKRYCQDENRCQFGMNTLRDLVFRRVNMREKFLDILLDFTHNENNSVRSNAIRIAKSLYEKEDFRQSIERHALKFLKHLTASQPPEALFGEDKKTSTIPADTWTEESIRLCLPLYLNLMPLNHQLIQPLATVYTAVNGDIKRVISRVLEIPVRGMGMNSPELLKLVENCPKGAETLVTRIISILTEQTAPSPALVEKVRDLYQKRVSDVRFLIPVLTGLEKREIISALPKLIKQSPPVVKEVFNRLLGLNASPEAPHTSPILPFELLVALHQISPEECELKTVMNATTLCFNERTIYTHNVLAIVIQQLVDINPIPVLFMRTVLQALSFYPKMVGFVMNILQRLITKQAWKQARIWEGFIKCCQKTRPHSFPLLIRLPPPQLKHVLQTAPELREGLIRHIRSMSAPQRSSIPSSILSVIEDNSETVSPEIRIQTIPTTTSAPTEQ
ncbi:unnamed protein product [Adineta ricciae]|uniref:Symplekin n=1 Tax=Adineta ricciae TaxID=249248 RepID=A0A814PSG0_ADIRI|nr:unnamed protein product [Adineta ricciae]